MAIITAHRRESKALAREEQVRLLPLFHLKFQAGSYGAASGLNLELGLVKVCFPMSLICAKNCGGTCYPLWREEFSRLC
jgi:hypothetical protein